MFAGVDLVQAHFDDVHEVTMFFRGFGASLGLVGGFFEGVAALLAVGAVGTVGVVEGMGDDGVAWGCLQGVEGGELETGVEEGVASDRPPHDAIRL